MAASASQSWPASNQRIAVVELDSVDPFERQHPPGGAPPVDLGNVVTGLGDHVLAELGRGRGLALEVELARGPLLEMGDDEPRPQPLELAAHPLDLRSRPFIGVDRPLEFLFDVRAEHLDRDFAAIGGDGAVDLRDRGGADGRFVELGKEAFERPLERLLDGLLDCGEGRWREVVLQLGQILRGAFTDEVGAGGEGLAELDRRRADLLQRFGVIGSSRVRARRTGRSAPAAELEAGSADPARSR